MVSTVDDVCFAAVAFVAVGSLVALRCFVMSEFAEPKDLRTGMNAYAMDRRDRMHGL